MYLSLTFDKNVFEVLCPVGKENAINNLEQNKKKNKTIWRKLSKIWNFPEQITKTKYEEIAINNLEGKNKIEKKKKKSWKQITNGVIWKMRFLLVIHSYPKKKTFQNWFISILRMDSLLIQYIVLRMTHVDQRLLPVYQRFDSS